jgi:hypothetical protein
MTRSLSILGDSLMDTGNTDQVGRRFGINPFEERIYNGGGNVKASDGLVLSEHIAQQLQGDVGLNQLVNLDTLTGLLIHGFGSAQLRTFAYAGATSGLRGSELSGLDRFQVGLKVQARALARLNRPDWDNDVLMHAGSNDVMDLINRRSIVRPVLASAKITDDQRLAARTAQRIVTNISEAHASFARGVDETVVLGLSRLSAIPAVQERARSLGGRLRNRLLSLVDDIAYRVNQGLQQAFRRHKDVHVVDSIGVWDAIPTPQFLDGLHPTSATSADLAAEIVKAINTSKLRSFGFEG